ncbi:MAG: IPT/TIG domain-containing protein [Bacteroidetes bacterium]|nr:IPT/TIG domain-containing protein [Bacteroidota bacterium]
MIRTSPFMHLLFVMFLVLGITSCKDDKDPVVPDNSPIINSIAPDSGPKGTVVTITGSKFSADPAAVQVYFNEVQASVTSTSANEIVVVVPAKAGTGKVRVVVGTDSGTGPVFNFVYTVSVSTFTGLGVAGFADGDASVAKFNFPRGMAIDQLDNIYVADELNQRIRIVAPNGTVTTFCGSGLAGHSDGTPAVAKFNSPYDVAYDGINNYIYVADKGNHCLRRLSISGYATTAAGIPGSAGYVDGPGTSARLNSPTGVAVEGELASVYIADAGNHCIREHNYLEILSTFAGSTVSGQQDGIGASAKFSAPADIDWDTAGYLYVTDKVNHNIRRISMSKEVTTVAGIGIAGYQDGDGFQALFNGPEGISAMNGGLVVADVANQRIRGIDAMLKVSSLAGDGTQGWGDGTGAVAKFKNPGGVVRDSNGDYFIADTGNHLIRKLVID